LPAYPGIIVKDSYWRWPERNLAGNAIDFHVQVLGLSFHDAMRQRSPASKTTAGVITLRRRFGQKPVQRQKSNLATPVRSNIQKPYDASSANFTMPKKLVTSSDKSSVTSPRAVPKREGLAAAKKSRWSAEGNRASNTLSFSPPPYNRPQRQRATFYAIPVAFIDFSTASFHPFACASNHSKFNG
jgi:hypothetical protein